MKTNATPHLKALDSGSDLWVVPDRRSSTWSKKIDWYLQFLISKATIHKPPQISKDLEQRMFENEFKVYSQNVSHSSPLLILSARQLPNKMTVQLPFLGDSKDWVSHVFQVWNDLKSPTLRVFLPHGLSSDQFLSHWPQRDVKTDSSKPFRVNYVLDSEGH
jgi:hypothetical protein